MPFQFIKDLSNSVVPVRLRRPTKNRGTQPNPTVNCHESDGSIPAGIPSTFPLPSPTLPSDSSYSRGVSPAREASDMAQLFLPFVQAFAGTIPLAGAPMQAAIGGLLTSLQAIDRRDKNRADLVGLESRLHRLNRDLCNAPPARDPLEQSRRDSLVRVLEGTSAQLTNLHKRRRFAYTSVTQAIAGCSSEIDRYLMECLWSFQMQSQNDMHEMRDFIIRGQFSAGSTAVGTVALGCVTLVDATGHEHSISVNFCTSFQQINEMLQVLFKRDSIEAHIQRRYLDKGQYDLCIDEGTQVTRLTSLRWSTIEAGTKIVMRVIIKQQMTLPSGVSYECHFCGAVNDVRVESIMYSLQRRAGCSIDCRQCKRRFQISRVPSNVEQSAGSLDVDTDDTTGAEMRLIRNFHVEETSGAYSTFGYMFRCMWGDLKGLHCGALVHDYNLSSHLREVHGIRSSDNLRIECKWNHCGEDMDKESLSRHVAECHTRIGHICNCGRVFSRRDILNKHMRNCSGKQ